MSKLYLKGYIYLLGMYYLSLKGIKYLTRMFYESPATTADSAVLPGVLRCRPLRRTVQVRLSGPIPRYGYQVARPPRLSEQARDPPASPCSHGGRGGGQARPSSRSRDSNS